MDSTTPAIDRPPMKKRLAAWLKFTLRWGIAIAGIYWVVRQMSMRDTLQVLDAQNYPRTQVLVDVNALETQETFHIVGKTEPIPRSLTVNKPDRKKVNLPGKGDVKLLAVDLGPNLKEPVVHRLLIEESPDHGKWIAPAELTGGKFELKVPYPRVDVGVIHLIKQANLKLLILAILIFPITFILTSARWHELLKALEIHIGLGLAFTLTMVGAFYNTFMPGSTGGDFLKALYVSRQTKHRTRAVMSVFIDRVIGLLALIILGGIAAATQWKFAQCRHIAILCGIIISGAIVSLTIYYQRFLHRIFGLDWIIKRLPMQKQVQNAVQVMEIYRQRPLLVLLALIVTFPVHIAVICSAMFAGKAFGLELESSYYWAVVPVIVLSGALPGPPQGAGVMEYFAIRLTETRGATISQAFALTMSIRLVQIFWNLTGAFFVIRGHFHAPTAAEQKEVESAG